jgi:hypothetical protein
MIKEATLLTDESLEEVDGVDRGDLERSTRRRSASCREKIEREEGRRTHVAFVGLLSVDAGDDDRVVDVVRLVDRTESGMDDGAFLSSPELNQSSTTLPLLLVPIEAANTSDRIVSFEQRTEEVVKKESRRTIQ